MAHEENPKERDLWNSIPKLEVAERGQTYFDLSLMAFENGQHTKSLALAETACDCFREKADEVGLANCQTSIAFNLYHLGRKQEAIRALIRAIVSYAKASDPQEWEYRAYLAEWFRETDEPELALLQWQRCLDYYTYENATYGITNALGSIANLLCDLDRCDEALVQLKRARAIFKSERDPMLVGATDIEIARCSNHVKDSIAAKSFALKAIGVFDSSNNPTKRSQAYSQLGRALNYEGEFQDALKALDVAYEIMTNVKPINFYAIYMIQKAKAHSLHGLGREAEAVILERRNAIINETLQWE
jgi:tetratricopeptide (TPR) repeat protein